MGAERGWGLQGTLVLKLRQTWAHPNGDRRGAPWEELPEGKGTGHGLGSWRFRLAGEDVASWGPSSGASLFPEGQWAAGGRGLPDPSHQ